MAPGLPPSKLPVAMRTVEPLRLVRDMWAYTSDSKTDFFYPGKRAYNAHVKSFNKTLQIEMITLVDGFFIVYAYRKAAI